MKPVTALQARGAFLGALNSRMAQPLHVTACDNSAIIEIQVPYPEVLAQASSHGIARLCREASEFKGGFRLLGAAFVENFNAAKSDDARLKLTERLLARADTLRNNTIMLTWLELQDKQCLEATPSYLTAHVTQVNQLMRLFQGGMRSQRVVKLMKDYRASLSHMNEGLVSNINDLIYAFPRYADLVQQSAIDLFVAKPCVCEFESNEKIIASPVQCHYVSRLTQALIGESVFAAWSNEGLLELHFTQRKGDREDTVLDSFSWPLKDDDATLQSALRFLGWSMELQHDGEHTHATIDFSKAKV